MEKVNILSLYGDPLAEFKEIGGAFNIYARSLGKALAKHDVEVHLISRKYSQAVKETVELGSNHYVHYVDDGRPTHFTREQFVRHFKRIRDTVLDFMDKEKITSHAMHTNYWLSGAVGRRVQSEINVPHVHSFHSLAAVKHKAEGRTDDVRTTTRWQEENDIVRNATVIANSPVEESDIRSNYDEPHRIEIIPGGYDPAVFHQKDKKLCREKLGIDPQSFVPMYVARFTKTKGLLDLIEAMRRFSEQNPDAIDVQFVLVGGGRTQEELDVGRTATKKVNEYGLDERTMFPGTVDYSELVDYYNAADVIVMPSHYEPFGLVPVEAMACGTPVIASNVGGLAFTVVDGKSGFHVPPKSPEYIAQKLSQMYRDRELLAELSTGAMRNSLERFSWYEIGRKTRYLIRELSAQS